MFWETHCVLNVMSDKSPGIVFSCLLCVFLQQLISTGHGLQASRYEPFMLLKQASVALSNVGLVPASHNKSV